MNFRVGSFYLLRCNLQCEEKQSQNLLMVLGPQSPVFVVLSHRKQFFWINRMPRIGSPKHGPAFLDVCVRVCPLSHTVKISPLCPMDAPSRLPRGARRLTTWLLAIEAAAARSARVRPRILLAIEAAAARSALPSLRALCSPLRQIYNGNG